MKIKIENLVKKICLKSCAVIATKSSTTFELEMQVKRYHSLGMNASWPRVNATSRSDRRVNASASSERRVNASDRK